MDESLFVKLENDSQYKPSIMERYQHLYPAFGSTIADRTDQSILAHGQGTRTDLFPKEGGAFAPKLLELNASGRFKDVAFDLQEDLELSQLIVSMWTRVTAQVNLIQHPYTAYLDSAPCLDTDSTMKKKKNKSKKKSSTTRSRSRSSSSKLSSRQAAAKK
jgi:hypothetical protein